MAIDMNKVYELIDNEYRDARVGSEKELAAGMAFYLAKRFDNTPETIIASLQRYNVEAAHDLARKLKALEGPTLDDMKELANTWFNDKPVESDGEAVGHYVACLCRQNGMTVEKVKKFIMSHKTTLAIAGLGNLLREFDAFLREFDAKHEEHPFR